MKTKFKLSLGWYLVLISLVFAVVAFWLYTTTYDAFHYPADRVVSALMFVSIWCMICIFIAISFGGDKSVLNSLFYVIAIAALTVAVVKFIIPCLSPIGIYFTVHNMGDVEANAVGVPRSIMTAVAYVLSILTLLVSSFCSAKKEVKNG